MIHAWWSAKSRVNQKPDVVSNIQNVNLNISIAQQELDHAHEYRERGHFSLAYPHALRALALFKKHKNKSDIPSALLLLGDLSRLQENFAHAIRWYRMAHRGLTTNSATRHLAPDAMVGLGLSYRGNAQYRLSISIFKQCLGQYLQNHDEEGQAFVLWAMGTTYRFSGQLKEAKKTLRHAIRLYQKQKDRSGLAYAHAALGGTLRMMGEYDESLSCYQQANKTFQKMGDQFGMAYSFCGMSNAFRMKNKQKIGWPYSVKAEKIYRRLQLKGPLAFVLWSQAQFYLLENNTAEAQKKLQEAELLFKATNDRRGQVYLALGWGCYFMRTKQLGLARKKLIGAERQAHKLHIALEKIHAQYLIQTLKKSSLSSIFKRYALIGAKKNSYRTIQSLP